MRKPGGVVEIFLQPGDYYFGDRHTRIRTLLGSCVSLVFWHPRLLLGGMSHFMLPTRRHPAGELDGRYGDEALELLLREIRGAGTRPRDYQLRLFGGASMFPQIVPRTKRHIGTQNIEAAEQLIQAHGLTCHGKHVGGIGHRNLIFDIWDGQLALKHLPGPTSTPPR